MKLAEIAARLGCTLEGDGRIEIEGLAPIENARPGTLTFLANPRYQSHLEGTKASAVILATDAEPISLPSLRTPQPYLAFADAIELFYEPAPLPDGIHLSAVIDPTAVVGDGARVGPHCFVGPRTQIGARACLDANVVIYAGCTIGDDFRAFANVTVREHVQIGHRVRLQPGCVIGGDGFGYAPTPEGTIKKIVQGGTVVLDNDVEIGANTTIDRAAVGETRIGIGAKIDNLVQIAHGCSIGPGTMIAAQAGLSGSTRVGRSVQMGGQAATAGHLAVGDGAQVAARSGLINDVPAGEIVSGFPQQKIAAWRRMVSALPRVPELLRRLRKLEKTVEKLAR